jgi:hypothetical protein
LVALCAARENGAAKWRALDKASARDGLNEKAEGGGKQATEKTSRTGERIEIREIFDRLRYRAQDRVEVRVHVLDLVSDRKTAIRLVGADPEPRVPILV